jgi:hypothetical protein
MERTVYRFIGSQKHLGEGSITIREVGRLYGAQTADKRDMFYFV